MFLSIALGLLGVAVYLGADTRAGVSKESRKAESKARDKGTGSRFRGAEEVDSQAVGNATTKDDEAEFFNSLDREQVGTDIPAIEKVLANQRILLTPLEHKVKDSPELGRLLEVHLDFGFAVLDAGEDQSLRPGMKLAVRREHHILAKLVVSDAVEEAQSVANIVRDSIPIGIELRQGDAVIPWASDPK